MGTHADGQRPNTHGGRDDDETLRVGPFEDDLARRAADPACDGCQHIVQGAAGVRSNRPCDGFRTIQ
jgi:hypothetical protein